MEIISEWFSTLKQIFSSAGEYYEQETDTDIGGKPLKVAILSGLLSAIITIVPAAITEPSTIAGALTYLILNPFLTVVGALFSAAITHLAGMLLGFNNGFSETFAAFAYATVVTPVASLFLFVPLIGPFVGLVLAAFAVYVQVKGVQKFQEVSLGKAAIAVLVPVLLIIGVLIVLAFVAGTMFAALMGSGAPPM